MKVNGTRTQQRLEIAQALDMGDVEIEAGLVHQRIRPSPSGPGCIESMPKCTTPFFASHSVAGDIHPGIVGRIFLCAEKFLA